jgi:serine palmitoyltransferase
LRSTIRYGTRQGKKFEAVGDNDDNIQRTMELDTLQARLGDIIEQASVYFHKVPGSAVFLRYIKSSYQNDPVRSAIEAVLLLFFVRYLLSPSYSTHKQNYVKLREDEIEELIDDWQPEPLVEEQTAFEATETERLPVLVG